MSIPSIYTPRLFFLLVGCFVSLFLVSCSSVSVSESIALHPNRKIVKPSKIYVRPYEVNESNFNVDRQGEELEEFKFKTVEMLASMTANYIEKRIVPSEVLQKDQEPPQGNVWLITGRFERVEQGSRALRAFVGLGAGATKIETATFVYDLSKKKHDSPILVIRTTGGSNLMGGAIGALYGFNPFLFAATVIVNLHHGLTWDTKRTAREISATISEFLYQNGAIPREDVRAPKRPGELWGTVKQ